FVAAGQKAQCLLGALRGADQPLAIGVFTDFEKHLVHQVGDRLVAVLALHYFDRGRLRFHDRSSKTLRFVSRSRIPLRRGHEPGKASGQRAASRSSMTRMMFSDVGTSDWNS